MVKALVEKNKLKQGNLVDRDNFRSVSILIWLLNHRKIFGPVANDNPYIDHK